MKDIESLQNKLLKVCNVPATSAGLNILLFSLRPLTVLMKQTRQAVRAIKQSISLRYLWSTSRKVAKATTMQWTVSRIALSQ
jgi:hypothetical protein